MVELIKTIDQREKQNQKQGGDRKIIVKEWFQNYLAVRLGFFRLTYQTPKLPLYRKQSIDLLCKSTDWFLYDGNVGV